MRTPGDGVGPPHGAGSAKKRRACAFSARAAERARQTANAVVACVEIKILRRVRAESSRPPQRHRLDACSMDDLHPATRHWLMSTQVVAACGSRA